MRALIMNTGLTRGAFMGSAMPCNPTQNYVSSIFMGLNQAPIVVMMDKYRTGLLWKLFMSHPDINGMIDKFGFVRE